MQWRFPTCFSFFLPVFVCAAGSVIDAQPSAGDVNPDAAVTARERTLLAGSFAEEKLSQWQTRLNLKDWNITVQVSRSTDLKPKTLGNIHWDLAKKTAVIRVLDPADYKLPYQAMLDDIEFTVVHELIHLEMAPVLTDIQQRSDANRREEEFAVNHMAEALLKLDRGR
jgi:hypothetical protein